MNPQLFHRQHGQFCCTHYLILLSKISTDLENFMLEEIKFQISAATKAVDLIPNSAE